MRAKSNMSSNANNLQRVVVRAPKPINANGAAVVVKAIDIASGRSGNGNGRRAREQARELPGVLADTDEAAPIPLRRANTFKLLNAVKLECVATLCTLGMARLVGGAPCVRLRARTFTASHRTCVTAPGSGSSSGALRRGCALGTRGARANRSGSVRRRVAWQPVADRS